MTVYDFNVKAQDGSEVSLKEYEGKIVIAPSKWFFDGTKIDIIPPRWIKI